MLDLCIESGVREKMGLRHLKFPSLSRAVTYTLVIERIGRFCSLRSHPEIQRAVGSLSGYSLENLHGVIAYSHICVR